MSIVLYKDKDGSTIPYDFVTRLDPPPKGFEIIDSPYLPENALDKAKHLIDDFCREEYQREDGADYTDLTNVGIAYTTTEDDRHEIQARVNLVDFRIETLADGKVVRSVQYSSLEELTEKGLQALSFDDLVYLSEEELAQVEAPLTPVWEHPKKSRVQTFDIHPEIPMADRHTFDLASHEVEEVNKKERFHRNYAAITVLKKCQEENRFATPDEQIILSKYVGWGGIPEAFDERADSWRTEYGMLKNILSPEEYASARESTLTAFYTPPTVINAVYKVMKQLGFREGNILEPSCGIGHFIGMLPEEMKESKVYGVELDTISAGIAQQLYQKTSIAAQGFEETNLPDSFFDAVVGNVPFGDFKVPDKRYDKHKFLVHDYFFAKSLDKLRPGGVMALITSKGTMDKENSAVRKYIAQRADLLGAIRLPNNTFKGNAGTEVVSDILILQKRDRIVDIEPDWVQLGTDENGILMNRYFVEHPEMILGEMKMVSGRFGPEATCVPYEGADLAEQLSEAVSNIHGELTAYEVEDDLAEEDNSIPADPTVRNFSYTVLDDKIYFRENSRMAPVEVSATAENRIKGMIRIRDSVRKLIELQTEDYPDSEIKTEQERLNALYDTFSKQYGLINSRANISAFSQDSSFSLLSALEVLGDEGQLERKADIFYKRTIKPHTPVTSVDTSSEALAVSMGEKARVDMDYMCELTGKTEEEIFADLKGVIFLNPMYGYGNSTQAKYLMADEYLSGNVREKLVLARKSAELYPEDYTVNVEALERVQPKDLTASEIAVRLGATWLPTEIVEQFMFCFVPLVLSVMCIRNSGIEKPSIWIPSGTPSKRKLTRACNGRRRNSNGKAGDFMPYIPPEVVEQARQIDLLTYLQSIPLYRQEKEWEALGLRLSRATMSNGLLVVYRDWLVHIVHRLKLELLKQRYLHIDETHVQVLKESGRSGKYPEAFLREYEGYIHTDAYSGYNAVSGVKRCLCYTHLRRAFVDALPPDQKKKERLIREKPLLEAFWSWAEKSAIGELPKSKLSKAFHYALNNREGFWNYLEDGNCSISNSLAENCIRPFVIGRKNWLFSGSPKGAEASAGIYTLFYLTLTAKA